MSTLWADTCAIQTPVLLGTAFVLIFYFGWRWWAGWWSRPEAKGKEAEDEDAADTAAQLELLKAVEARACENDLLHESLLHHVYRGKLLKKEMHWLRECLRDARQRLDEQHASRRMEAWERRPPLRVSRGSARGGCRERSGDGAPGAGPGAGVEKQPGVAGASPFFGSGLPGLWPSSGATTDESSAPVGLGAKMEARPPSGLVPATGAVVTTEARGRPHVADWYRSPLRCPCGGGRRTAGGEEHAHAGRADKVVKGRWRSGRAVGRRRATAPNTPTAASRPSAKCPEFASTQLLFPPRDPLQAAWCCGGGGRRPRGVACVGERGGARGGGEGGDALDPTPGTLMRLALR